MSARDAWLEAARAIKRAMIGDQQIRLLGQRFTVTAESRGARDDRDYPVIAALARGRHTVLDIGANLGWTALIMARAEPAANIIAFDASEKACRLIERNAQLSALDDRIAVVEAVLAERSGLPIEFFWDHASGGASIIRGYLGHQRPLRKTSLALDDFVTAEQIEPDLLKIDVEGAEARVLQGAEETFERHRPTALVELHSWQGTALADNAASILDWAAARAYDVIYLRTRQKLKDVTPLEGRGRCHVLLLPTGQSLPGTLDGIDLSSL